MKQRVLVGMSGEVDSSVAGYLLREQGYEVVGARKFETLGLQEEEKIRLLGRTPQLTSVKSVGPPSVFLHFFAGSRVRPSGQDYEHECAEGRTL